MYVYVHPVSPLLHVTTLHSSITLLLFMCDTVLYSAQANPQAFSLQQLDAFARSTHVMRTVESIRKGTFYFIASTFSPTSQS